MKMNEPVGAETIEFKLNGDTVSAWAGETIIQAAKRHGVDIPHLCYKEGYRPDGNCRACMVEIKGERVLAPSCCRAPAKGMEVQSNSPRAVHSQKMVVELLMSDVPKVDLKPGDNELFHWAGELSANLLTNDATDPVSGMPEFKVCAVRLERVTRLEEAVA